MVRDFKNTCVVFKNTYVGKEKLYFLIFRNVYI